MLFVVVADIDVDDGVVAVTTVVDDVVAGVNVVAVVAIVAVAVAAFINHESQTAFFKQHVSSC